MFIYPENLKAKPMLWLWLLRDIAVIGIGALLSVLALTQGLGMGLLVVTVLYAFLTIQVDGSSILQNLARAVREVAEHTGNVWTPVVALRREDAERLGYDSAESWRALVNASVCDIATAYKIQPDNLRWYAAFHQKPNQVHIHMIIFSADPK